MRGPKGQQSPGIVPASRVRLGQEPARVGPSTCDKDEPQIVLIRDGETIQAIEVICTCGRRTRLTCVF